MAALTSDQTTELWTTGQCEKFSLFAVKAVNTGDTIDLSQRFRVILQTAWMGATVSGVISGSATGTTATAPNGLSNAGAFLLVQGVAI